MTIVACGGESQPKTLSFTDVFSPCHRNVTLRALLIAYEVRYACPYPALGHVHHPAPAKGMPRKLQPAARGLRETQPPRHGPRDHPRPPSHRRPPPPPLPP